MRISTAIAATAVSLSITTAPAPAPAAEGVGEIVAAIATASVSGQLGDRSLAAGSKVFVGDLVTTDAKGSAQLLFADGTRMVVGANSSLMIDEFLFSGKATESPAESPAENATENQFAVRALAGSFRFISGDSGDRGYSIRTPSARIDVRGTAFDFSVTPEGGTKMVLLEGETALCNEENEGSEDDDCVTVATPCALLQTEPGEDVEEIKAGNRRVRETREHFPYMTSQSSLLEEFRIAGHGCTDGGLATSVLDRPAILVPAAGGAAAILLCILLCLPDDDPNTDTSNATN